MNRVADDLGVELIKAQEIDVMGEFLSILGRELDGMMEKAIGRAILKKKLANADGAFEEWQIVIKNLDL